MGARGTAAGDRMMASMNLPQSGRNDVAAGHLDGSIGHEIGSGNSSLHPYPMSASAYHEARDSDVAANGAWGRSSGIYPKVGTVFYRSLGEKEDQKAAVHDLTASRDRMKVRTNRL